MAKREEIVNLGRVILYRDFVLDRDEDVLEAGGGNMIEVLRVVDNANGRLHAGAYVLPVTDAQVFTSDEGLVYCYNASPRYLEEVKHLGDVERNIIVSQAFSYPGRMTHLQKGNGLVWGIMIVLGLVAIIAMFT